MGKSSALGVHPTHLMMLAVVLEIAASIILAVHVYFLNDRIQVHINSIDPHGNVNVTDKTTDRETGFIFAAVALYSLGFFVQMYAHRKEMKVNHVRLHKLERRLALVLEDVDPNKKHVT